MNWGFSCKKYKDEVKYLHRELDKMHHMVDVYKRANSELSETIVKLRKKRGKRKYTKVLRNAVGFTRVSKDESNEMYRMWNEGASMTDIASYLKRSNSCVSKHINKKYMEENNGKQMETSPGRKDRTSKEEE